jgi:peptide/nickel transport system permease protein
MSAEWLPGLGRRIGAAALTLLASSFIVFAALHLAPGDPISLVSGGRRLSADARAALTAEYGFDDPFFVQYWHWLTGVLQVDFGRSTVFKADVWSLISPRLATTFSLVLYSSLLIILIGVGAGLLAGLRGERTRTAVTATTALALGIPSFVAAVVLITVFAVEWGWFPVTGAGEGFADRIWHLTLPAVALALIGVAYVARIAAAAIAEEAEQDHVLIARGRGLPRRMVVRRHILRNAMIPITTACGLTIASLIAGTAIVEVAFQLDGVGSLLVSSVNARDFAVVQAISLLVVFVFVVVNTIVDVTYSLLDPRVAEARTR